MSRPGERTPREVLADSDRHRYLAAAADMAMTKIRLGERPVTTGRRTWFRPNRETDHVTEFDAAETSALYEALADVRSRHEREAKRLDDTLAVLPEQVRTHGGRTRCSPACTRP